MKEKKENMGQRVLEWTTLCLSYQKVKPGSFPVVSLGSGIARCVRMGEVKEKRKPLVVFSLEWEGGGSREVRGVEEMLAEGLGHKKQWRFGRGNEIPFELASVHYFRRKDRWALGGRWMETEEGRRVFVRRVK